jgi:uncharacterized Zn-binding protein involved in type VI secretion
MPGIVRLGDVNSAGGKAMVGNRNLIVDNRPVVTIGTPVSPHAPCPKVPIHCRAVTTTGSRNVIVNNKPVNITGNVDSCGHPRVTGSRTFIVGS